MTSIVTAGFGPYGRTGSGLPGLLAAEADHLVAVGVEDVWARLDIDGDALLVTPYHCAANRARELARGDGRHGSCGMGFGEAMAYDCGASSSPSGTASWMSSARHDRFATRQTDT